MGSHRKLQLPVYTYEFAPFEKAEPTLFETKESIQQRMDYLKEHKQEILQKHLDRLATGELVPQLNGKSYRCKVLYNRDRVIVFKIENVKDESFDWDFGLAQHKIGPNCHVIIDNRKDMQHIAIERKPKAFSSPNIVKNILYETLRPLLKQEGLLIEINPQFHPKDFWDFIDANREYGIKEIRFYFPYPNLPAISDKYGNAMKEIGIDYHCMPGLILFAPDDLDMVLDREDPGLNFWIEAAGESGIPVAIQTKKKGSRIHLVGKNKCVTWPLDKKVLETLDPQPNKVQQQELKLEFLEDDEKARMQEKITEFVNNGRFIKIGTV